MSNVKMRPFCLVFLVLLGPVIGRMIEQGF